MPSLYDKMVEDGRDDGDTPPDSTGCQRRCPPGCPRCDPNPDEWTSVGSMRPPLRKAAPAADLDAPGAADAAEE